MTLSKLSKPVRILPCTPRDTQFDDCTASKTSARQRSIQVSPLVDEISEHAFQFGLANEELQRVASLVANDNHLDQSSITTLIKNLYPAERVPSHVVITFVSSLGRGKHKPAASSQAALVRWLSLVQDVLQDSNVLSRLYGVLFDLLDMITLRTALCQLLVVITRRKHVRHFRIQRLLELCQQAGNEQALLGLLKVYKNFCPDIILGTTVSSRALSMSSSIEWRNRLMAIQSANSSIKGEVTQHGGFMVARNVRSRTSTSILPEVHTFHPSVATSTLEDIRNVDDFVNKLELIEPPSQIIAGLQDPLLQKYILLRISKDASQRLEFWLLRHFEEEIETLKEGFGLSVTLPEILSALASYTESSKELAPIVKQFLESYLPFWDGTSNLGSLLDLLTYLPCAQSFQELQATLLIPLELAIVANAHDPFDTLFDFYTNLTLRWVMRLVASEQEGATSQLEHQQQAFIDLFNHISVLAMSAFAKSDSSSSGIIRFYRTIASAIRDVIRNGSKAAPILVPSPQLVYLLTMSSSLSDLSGICSVLTTFKQAFEAEMRISGRNPTEHTRRFNGYLMDICNLLWRSRALVATDPNAVGCLCPTPKVNGFQKYLVSIDQDYNVALIFGLSHNPNLSSISRSAFANFENVAERERGDAMIRHAGPVTQRSLTTLGNQGGVEISWKDYRILVLNWLEMRGPSGIKKFMYATMKDLMK